MDLDLALVWLLLEPKTLVEFEAFVDEPNGLLTGFDVLD